MSWLVQRLVHGANNKVCNMVRVGKVCSTVHQVGHAHGAKRNRGMSNVTLQITCHWLSLKPIYASPMASSVSWWCLHPFFVLHAHKGSCWASSSATHFTRFMLNLFHSLDTGHVARLLFLARSVNRRDILCLWTFSPPTLCSPHGRKIIPHFIHLNNVK